MKLRRLSFRKIPFLVLLLSLCGCSLSPVVPPSGPVNTRWAVYFSPLGGCTEAMVSQIEKARKSILVQAYSFTSSAIAKALLGAKRRGVEVRIILDKSQESETRYSSLDFFLHAGIPTLVDKAHAIAHNKIMILDGETVITGSFNFTRAAEERNAENLLIIHDPELARRYTENWKLHAAHSITPHF